MLNREIFLRGSANAEAYRSATPFRHLVLDDFIEDELHAAVRAEFEDEPASSLEDEIFHVMASKDPPEGEAFARFRTALTSPTTLEAIFDWTGERVTAVELRAFAYLPGHYLLPHADRDAGDRRRIAFAYYVDTLEGLVGGELDLYAVEVVGGEIVRTTPAVTIDPVPNRCALFEVTEHSIHRVREVTAGGRLSIAGWFLR